ncbi:MAG: glycosyl hydrolase 53 family protein, partial [Acholeplasmataceae bacterium]|nr:glycosyl hydrolase 53 family protein [Acholeplasmataceae bacterium]
MKKRILPIVLVLSILLLVSCSEEPKEPKFDINPWTPTLGSKTNQESYNVLDASFDEENFKIEPIEALQDGKRSDFMMGVDASMIKKVLDQGGVYYNLDGIEQNVFEILADAGVNYMRVRVWNDPFSPIGISGGGDMDIEQAFWIAREARRVNMRIILDLHYSDTWADPEHQVKPYAWETLTFTEMLDAIETFTYDSVMYFKNRGVTPQMIQIGNEINNGMLFEDGRIIWNDATSYDRLADMLKSGIRGAKKADQFIKTIIHLADGGKFSIFDEFFSEMEDRNVNYDIIGASFYPFYHGTLDRLADNLNQISAKYNKQVFVAETSYAYTQEGHVNASNIFGTNQEDNGGYLATIQGQATSIRDVIEIVANVPNNKGLGIVYWEPAWLPVVGAGWAEDGTLATWSNQALFTYSGKALPSINVFKDVRSDQEVNVNLIGLKSDTIEIGLNIVSLTDSESKMPNKVVALTDVDSYIYADVVWNQGQKEFAEANVGEHLVNGVVTYGDNTWNVVAYVRSIQNYIINPGFEIGKVGANDEPVKTPWVVESTPNDVLIGKLQTNKDFRSGSNNFNYYHTQAFSYSLYQDITIPNGTYTLSAYIMGETNSKNIEHYMF